MVEKKGSLKLSWKQPKKVVEPCKWCKSQEHESGACPSLSFCDRCGEKGHFPKVCPHHTETDEQRAARRKEEKKNWEHQLRKNAKNDRTTEDWSRGRSLSPSDDDVCPFPKIDRPFTEDERERARKRREWFQAREARQKARQAREEPQRAAAPAPEGRGRGEAPAARPPHGGGSSDGTTSDAEAEVVRPPLRSHRAREESRSPPRVTPAAPAALPPRPRRPSAGSSDEEEEARLRRRAQQAMADRTLRRGPAAPNPRPAAADRHASPRRERASATRRQASASGEDSDGSSQRSVPRHSRDRPAAQRRSDGRRPERAEPGKEPRPREQPSARDHRRQDGDSRREKKRPSSPAAQTPPRKRPAPERSPERGAAVELPIQKVVVAEVARPEAVPAPEPTDDGLTAHQRLLLSSKAYQKKVKLQSDHFLCPSWATLPESGVRFEVRKGGQKLPSIQVDRNLYYLFGRGEGLVDFVVEHPSASRVHFALIHDGAHKAAYVYDLGSKAKTRIDGKAVPPRQAVLLPDGAMLTVGESTRCYILRRRSLWEQDD
eukprot:EG_transcript_6830